MCLSTFDFLQNLRHFRILVILSDDCIHLVEYNILASCLPMSFSLVARQAVKNRGALSVAAATLGTAWAASSQTSSSENNDYCLEGGERVPDGGTFVLGDASRVYCSAAVKVDSSPIEIDNNNSTKVMMAPILLGEERHGATAGSFSLRKRATLARMNRSSTKQNLISKYEVNPDPIGEGAFGQVFVARDRNSGELVAVKKIWKQYSDNQDFVREMSTLLQIQAHGGHPHICQLRENFDEPENFALVLDLIKGGEMFDHLVESGAYSELDASRLIREVASALAFMHGIGLVHCDLKPENLMLSSKTDSASIKIVDFGCTEHLPGVDQTTKRFFGEVGGADVFTPEERPVRSSGGTVAYAPPESFDSDSPVDAPLDMWALGIILHIMLTGVHPFDPNGDADDEKLEKRIKIMRKPPLDTPNTEHLSPSAMDLLTRLLEPDPSKRLKASEMLEHSWVRGETAKSDVIADSDQKLSRYRKFRSKIETHVFQELMSWSENKNRLDPSKNGESLVEKAFKSMDKEAKGFLTMDDISKEQEDGKEEESAPMTLSSFSDLLGENMQNKYFPAGHIIFHEGEQGDYMYFLNSGTCEVLTKDGFHHILKHGDTFGEGGLIMEHGKRSATIKTVTPVHAIQIDRECFTKYLLGSNSALALKIKERVNKRKFGRAEYIIGQQEDLVVHSAMKGGKIYSDGDKADSIFFVAEGTIDVRNDGHTVYQANPGELLGVQSFYFNRSRDADAVCRTDHCTVKAINSKQFKELAATMPELKRALHELALRREFQRAIVRKLKTSFSASDLRQVFDQIDLDHSGLLSRDELRDLLTYLDVSISEEELKMLIDTLDLDSTGFINFEEFTTLFA